MERSVHFYVCNREAAFKLPTKKIESLFGLQKNGLDSPLLRFNQTGPYFQPEITSISASANPLVETSVAPSL